MIQGIHPNCPRTFCFNTYSILLPNESPFFEFLNFENVFEFHQNTINEWTFFGLELSLTSFFRKFLINQRKVIFDF